MPEPTVTVKKSEIAAIRRDVEEMLRILRELLEEAEEEAARQARRADA